MHNITNARIKLVVLPLTDRGKEFSYESPNFNSGQIKKTLRKSNAEEEEETVAYDEEEEVIILNVF